MKNQVVTYTDYQGQQFPALVQTVNPTSEKHMTLVLISGASSIQILPDVRHSSIAMLHDGEPRNCWEAEKKLPLGFGSKTVTDLEYEKIIGDLQKQLEEWCLKYQKLMEKYNASTEGVDEQLQKLANDGAVKSESQPEQTAEVIIPRAGNYIATVEESGEVKVTVAEEPKAE